MRPGSLSFEALLDATLTSAPEAGRTTAAMPLRWLPDPGLALLVASGGRLAGEPRSMSRAPRSSQAPRGSQAPRAHGQAHSNLRPARSLTPPERDALGRLRAAGAAWLREDFTASELRRAWRQLARLWHPDVAPAGSDPAAMNRTFAGLAASYRLLRLVSHRL